MTPIERFKVDEGVNKYGVRKTVHFDGDQVVSEFSYDAAPIIEQCKEERIVSAGERWGDGRKIGTLPPTVMAQVFAIQGVEERKKFILNYLRANPAFVSFDKFLKT
jgi:hypothetical protein